MEDSLVLSIFQFFISVFGVQLFINNIFITAMFFTVYTFFLGWHVAVLLASITATLLAFLLTWFFNKSHQDNDSMWTYAVHLFYVPNVMSFFSLMYVPQTSSPVGVIVAILFWGLGWIGIWIYQPSNHKLLWLWLIPCIFMSVFTFSLFHVTPFWVPFTLTTIITLLLTWLIF